MSVALLFLATVSMTISIACALSDLNYGDRKLGPSAFSWLIVGVVLGTAGALQ